MLIKACRILDITIKGKDDLDIHGKPLKHHLRSEVRAHTGRTPVVNTSGGAGTEFGTETTATATAATSASGPSIGISFSGFLVVLDYIIECHVDTSRHFRQGKCKFRDMIVRVYEGTVSLGGNLEGGFQGMRDHV